jgi:germination protein M
MEDFKESPPLYQEGENDFPFQQSDEGLTRQVKLYFGAEGSVWQIETREINMQSLQLEDRIKEVIGALLKGPEHFGSTPIPKGTQLLNLFLDQEGIAYLDFSEEFQQNHPGGTWGEMMTIYSSVNTIMDNFHTIQGVKILILGKELDTLKGHLDLRYPFSLRTQP